MRSERLARKYTIVSSQNEISELEDLYTSDTEIKSKTSAFTVFTSYVYMCGLYKRLFLCAAHAFIRILQNLFARFSKLLKDIIRMKI